tara:strand:+ start:1464 stop:2798 length:1335 start_codon:yes stop_codon:yes gene_type:complete
MSVQGSIYEVFKIRSADGKNEVDIYSAQFRVGNIYYYENILSPFVTGVVTIISTSGAAESQEDTQGRLGSLHTALPLEAGCEVFLKIKDDIGKGLDFSSKRNTYKRLYVNEVQVIDKKSNSEIIQLRLISKIGWRNNTERITKHFRGKISGSIKKILRSNLGLPRNRIKVDDSSNSYSFMGMTKRPFDLIAMLAKQTIPKNTANPGYFAFETKSGFNYVSADSIINAEPYKETYFYNGKVQASQQTKDNKNNYKINSLSVKKDQNLTKQIRSGVYANKTIFFNPASYQFTEIDITVSDDKLFKNPKFSTLGKQPNVPSILTDNFKVGKKFHRVQTAILNIGGEKENINPNNSPEFYYAAGTTRYNLLFSQSHSITIPCNTDLEAGTVIRLEIEDITEKKIQGPDQKASGNYIIQSLCHYFEAEKSVTSLTLIRDSYGLHFSKNT